MLLAMDVEAGTYRSVIDHIESYFIFDRQTYVTYDYSNVSGGTIYYYEEGEYYSYCDGKRTICQPEDISIDSTIYCDGKYYTYYDGKWHKAIRRKFYPVIDGSILFGTSWFHVANIETGTPVTW